MSRFVLLYYAFFSPKLQTWMPKRSKTCILCSGKPHLQFLILENMRFVTACLNVFRTLLIKTGGSHVRKHMETSHIPPRLIG